MEHIKLVTCDRKNCSIDYHDCPSTQSFGYFICPKYSSCFGIKSKQVILSSGIDYSVGNCYITCHVGCCPAYYSCFGIKCIQQCSELLVWSAPAHIDYSIGNRRRRGISILASSADSPQCCSCFRIKSAQVAPSKSISIVHNKIDYALGDY